jgi:hypothetical protein
MELKLKKITPLYNAIVTTATKYEEHSNIPGTTLIDAGKMKRGLNEYQVVIAVGTTVQEVKVGDLVCINPDRYRIIKQKSATKSEMAETYEPTVIGYNFNVLELDGTECLMLYESDIKFIINDYEEVK